MTDEARRVRLKGDSDHSAHTIELKVDGTLVVELYDFSDSAKNWVGGDIAWLITIQKESVPQIVAALEKDSVLRDRLRDMPVTSDDPMLGLLPLLPLRFNRYYDVKEWLDSNHIPYTKETDSLA